MTETQFAEFIKGLPSTASRSFYTRNDDGSVDVHGSLANVPTLIGIGFPIEDLRRIRGDLSIVTDGSSNLRFSRLEAIDGGMLINPRGAEISFPVLADVGGTCKLGGRVAIPMLSIVKGDLAVSQQLGLQLPNLSYVAGDLGVQWRDDVAPLVLPNLRGVGGHIGLICVTERGEMKDSDASQVVLELPKLRFIGRAFHPYNATFSSPSYIVIEDDSCHASVLKAIQGLDQQVISALDAFSNGSEAESEPGYLMGL